jgi:hypothetical protein
MLGSPPALITSPLSLLYKEWTWEHYRKLNLTFFTPFVGRSMGVFIGGLSRLVKVAGRPSFVAASTLGVTDLLWHMYETVFENMPNPDRPTKEVGLAGPTLAQLGPGFVPQYPLVLYCLWPCLILDIMKICMDFGPCDAFPSSDVPEMVNQQNSWNSLVISTYLLYLEWNVGMLVVNICL